MGRTATNTIKPHRQAMEDQILAILQASDLPMRPGQIIDALGGTMQRPTTCRCQCGHEHQIVRTSHIFNSDLAPLLKRLERKGRVERIAVPRGPMNPTGAHWWRAADSEDVAHNGSSEVGS